MALKRRRLPIRVHEVAPRIAGHLRPSPVGGAPAAVPGRLPWLAACAAEARRIDPARTAPAIAAETHHDTEPAGGNRVAEKRERRVEVFDRLGQIAGVEERQRDVAFEERLLPRFAALAVNQEIERGSLAEILRASVGAAAPICLVTGLEGYSSAFLRSSARVW
jgi:hypothetical protein